MISDFFFVLRLLRQTRRNAELPGHDDDNMIWGCLIDNDSYRLPASANEDKFIGFRVFSRTFKRWFRNDHRFNNKQHFDALILGGGGLDAKETLEYVAQFSGYKNLNILYRDSVSFSFIKHPLACVAFTIWALLRAFLVMFSVRKANQALIISSVCEIAFALHLLRKHNSKVAFDYLPYEVESNFIYSVLSKRRISVTKLPSAGPLSTHHSRTLADSVIVTSAYHLEEISRFGNRFRARILERWPPERAYKCIPKYSENITAAAPNTLGFYSHGQWLRNRLNHAKYGSAIEQDEIRILHYLRDVSAELNATVFLYLHPRELKAEVFPETKKFYEKHLSGVSYEIKIHEDSTAMHFEEIDIAVAAFSTIVFERIYFGFKILIGTEAMPNFPIKGSPLNNICFSDYQDFRQKIIASTGITNEAFFKKNELESYLWNNFLKA